MFTNSDRAKKVLIALLGKPKTRVEVSKEIGVALTPPYICALADAGLVKTKAVVHTGRRGRPAHVLMLTDKGRKRAQRLVAA